MSPKPVLASIKTLVERFSPWTATSTFKQVREGLSQDNVVLSGWLHRKPRQISKNLLFAVLRSPQGDLIQVVDNSESSPLRRLKPDSVVSVRGQRILKKGTPENVPEYDVHISDVQVLSESDGVAGTLIHEVKEWPQERRYIQLRQPQSQQYLRARSKIIKTCRDTLDDAKFTEVETPLLFKSTPEGAREFFVPSRKKGKMYALPQSPQQYKQLLIASGIDRYYQVAKCFRDEDLRQDRQPEFTQLDMEMGFANGSDVRRVVERLVETVWLNHSDEPLHTRKCAQSPSSIAKPGMPLESMTYAQAIENYGIDKPDLRYPYTFQTLKITANRRPEFTILEALRLSKTELNNVSLDTVMRPDLYAYRVPLSIVHGNEQDLNNAANHFNVDETELQEEIAKLNASEGDVILLGDRLGSHAGYENPTPLGRARQLLIEQIETYEKTTHPSVAVWMQAFPLFEPKETTIEDGYPVYDYNSLSSTHHPFTMVALDDLPKLFQDPLSCHGQHYDLVVDGVELGGGSTRIHDAELQRKIFDDILKITNSQQLFGHLLAALASGCPPHAGLAIGLDRMIAMLCGTKSIKDVIAFPKTISGADPVIGSPSKVSPEQLRPYHVKVQ